MLGHAAADAGAVQLRDVDVVLLRDLADERRRALRVRDVFGSTRGRGCGARRRCRRRRRGAAARCIGVDAAPSARRCRSDRCSRRRSRRCASRLDGGGSPAGDDGDDAVDGNGLPFLDRISDSTPAAGDGISASTLSVEISKSGSSRSTLSPTFLIQRTMVPSAIDSPICGITTSVAIWYLGLSGSEPVPTPAVLHAPDPTPRVASSHVDRGAMRGVRRLTDRLRHRRMRVNRANQLLHRGFRPQRERGFRHQLGGARADDMDAQDLVVLLSATIFTKPRARRPSARGRARGTGKSRPARRGRVLAACSVSPTLPISGSQYVQPGTWS